MVKIKEGPQRYPDLQREVKSTVLLGRKWISLVSIADGNKFDNQGNKGNFISELLSIGCNVTKSLLPFLYNEYSNLLPNTWGFLNGPSPAPLPSYSVYKYKKA